MRNSWKYVIIIHKDSENSAGVGSYSDSLDSSELLLENSIGVCLEEDILNKI